MMDDRLKLLKQDALEQLALSRKNFANILNVLQDDSGALRLISLFDHSERLEGGFQPAPYQEFLPHAWLGFDPKSKAEFTVSQETGILAKSSRNRVLRIAWAADTACTWLSLEVRLPWSCLRSAKRAMISAFCEARCESTIALQIYCQDVSGLHHEMIASRVETLCKTKLSVIRLEQDINLPSKAIDFSREPHIALFIEPKALSFSLYDIDARFI